MQMIQLYKRINGKVEVKTLPQTHNLRLAEIEDELNFHKNAMTMASKRYAIAKAKQKGNV